MIAVVTATLVVFASALLPRCAAAAGKSAAAFSFVSIGDWGCVGIGGRDADNEKLVAKSFMKAADTLDAKFVLNTGDNFYYCGVENLEDPQFRLDFEEVYTDKSMMVPWYGCLGNHDYGYPGSAAAQISYVSPMPNGGGNRWQIPDRYYYKRLVFPGQVNISLLVLDASPCQWDYRGDDPALYDPCGTVIPGCPGCTFHENVIMQSCMEQYNWLKKMIKVIPDDDWKIVMAHAPAGEIDVNDFVGRVQELGADLYINGHVHVLGAYTIDGAGTYVTSGAGCMVNVSTKARGDPRLYQQEVAANRANRPDLRATRTTARAKNDVYRAQLDRKNSAPGTMAPSKVNSCFQTLKGHECQVVWEQLTAGYTTHTFSADYSVLTTNFHDAFGFRLYSVVTAKGEAARSPVALRRRAASKKASEN